MPTGPSNVKLTTAAAAERLRVGLLPQDYVSEATLFRRLLLSFVQRLIVAGAD